MRGGGKNLRGYPVAEDTSGDSTGEGADSSSLLLPDQMPSQSAMPVAGPSTADSMIAPVVTNATSMLDLPDKKSPLEQTFQQVQGSDPDRSAKVLSLQKKMDEPAAFIDKHLDTIQNVASAPSGSFFKQLEDQYPGTTKFLSDPKNMAVAHDDIPNASEHEGLINHIKDAWNFEKSALQSGSLQEELAFTRYQQLQGQATGQSDMFRVGGSVAQQLGITEADPQKRAELIAQKISELDQNRPEGFGFKRGVYGATEFLPQILGGFGYGAKYAIPAAGLATAATAWAGPLAGLSAATAGGAGLTGGELEYNYKLMTGMSYDQLLKVKDVNGNPLPDSTAKIAATAMGAATAGLSLLKLTTVLDTIPGGKDFLAKFTADAGEKVLESPQTYQEALKSFAKNYVTSVAHGVGAMEGITAVNLAGTEAAKLSSGQDFDHPGVSDVLGEFGQTAKDAALTFGVLGLPGTGGTLLHDLSQAKKVEQTKQFYTALGNAAEASKLRARLPEAHQEFVSGLTKDSPVENIYIPADAAQAYFQSKNIDTDRAMAELGVTKSFEEAKATGGDVKIPLSTWTDKIVGTEHYQGLADDIKFDPEDMTARQVNERKAEIESQVRDILEKRKAESQAQSDMAASQEKHEQTSKVFQMIQDQLKAAGLSGPETEFNPQIHEAFFNTLSQHLGVEPEELAKRFPLKINRFENLEDVPTQVERAPEGASEVSEPTESVAAQSAYKSDVLQQIRSDVEGGSVEKGRVTYDQDGNVTSRHGAVSTYPEYFQKKGYKKKETLRAIDKHLAGEKLTDNQAKVIDDLYHSSGYDKEAKRASPAEPFLQAASYQQGAPKLEGPRGRIRIGKEGYAIDLFKNADKSTFLHETGHYFLDVMGHIAGDENAPKQVKEDYKTLLDWMGVKSKEEIGSDQHEKFARGFEQYLMEGKAPSSALTRAFNRFRKWLTSVYKQVSNLKVDMSDDVRGVMDRMLASEKEVERAQHAVGYSGDQIEGIPVEVQAKIHDLQSQARDQAESSLIKEQMVETTAKRKEFLKSERARLQDVAEKQVEEMPIFKASEEAVQTIGKERTAGTIAEKFLTEKLKPQDMGKLEALAEVHGFGSGEELAKAMIMAEEGKLRDHEINSRVEAGMAPHADLMDTDAIKSEAIKAIHGEKMTELLALERQALERLVNKKVVGQEVMKRKRIEARVDAEAAKSQARELLSKKPIKEATNARTYITAERNAAVNVAKALAKRNYEAAAEYKRQQMLNHAIAAEAMRNKVEADKSISYLSDFAKRKNDLKDMPYGFMRQIDKLLSGSGFSEPKTEDAPTLINIAKDMASQKEEPAEIANRTGYRQDPDGNWVPETISDFVARVNDNYYGLSLPDSVMSGVPKEFNDLSLGELRELKGSIKSISDVGKKLDRYLGEYKTADIKQAAAEFRKSVEENYGTPFAEDLQAGSKHASKIGELLAPITRIPGAFDRMLDTILTTCHKLDGLEEGPAKDNIYRPFENAESREIARTADAMKEMDGIFAKHYALDDFAKYKDTRIDIDGRYFTKDEILSMALNWGNEGNRQRLMDGFGFDAGKMQRIFSHLGKNDWEFAQDTWNHLNKYWPEIANLEMDINGIEPKGVEAAPFANEHGKFDGGYYPISYDSSRSAEAYKNNQERDALYKQFSTAAAHTEQGHAKARASNVNRPISLDLSVLKSHHEDVIHDLEFRRAVIDVSRFLNQKDTKAAIVNALGVHGYAAISDWLKSAAGGGGEPLSVFDKAAQWFRFKTTFFNLGYRLVSAPKIAIENMINVSSELGISGATRAVKDYYFGGGTHEMVASKSDFMRLRGEHLNRDLSDIQNKWQGTDVGAFKKFAFFVHAYLDQGMSFPLWADTYNRAIAEHGKEKLAINQADEAVKRTFMSGGKIDQPEIMRGNEKMKALTTAYGYQSMMWNRFSQQKFEAGQEWAQGNHTAAVAIAARATIYTFMLPAVTAALTRETLRNSQGTNDEDRKKRMTETLIEEATPLKFVPVLRDLSPYLIKKAMGDHASIQLTPLEEAAQTLLDPIGETLHAFGGKGFSDKFPEKTANAISLVTGVPKEINDMTFNFIDWQQNHGELTWKDFLSRRTKR